MKKIIVSAYALSPIRGSECAVGWEITKRLGEYFEVVVIMCSTTPIGDNYAEEVENYLAEFGPVNNLTFVYLPMPNASRKYIFLHDIGFWPAYYWGYRSWQKSAYKTARELHLHKNFDLAYQLNMIGFREPGYLWKLPIPYVWGPTNGFHCIPFSFLKSLKGKDYIFQHLKHFLNKFQIFISLRPKRAAKKASIVWCVDQISNKIIKNWGGKTDILQETGLNTANFESESVRRKFDGHQQLKLVWSGAITSGKALDILIDALIEIKERNFSLLILGDGPLIQEMKTRSFPIKDKIEWKGWVTKKEAIEQVKSAHLLIHTSLKEGTPHSVLEAIGYNVPVICHDTCGMGIVVNDKNGFKIPYKNFETSISFISKLLVSIFENPEILNIKYKTIGQTHTNLGWDNKVQYIASKINEIIVS
jgi:glycosyltransferase involved in cell wall biosynthesis